MANGEPPDEAGDARRSERDDGGEKIDEARQPERIGLAEHVERGEIADECERHDVGEEPPQPPEDVDGVLRMKLPP